MAGFKDQIEPMSPGNMRQNGVRSLDVSCPPPAIMSADRGHSTKNAEKARHRRVSIVEFPGQRSMRRTVASHAWDSRSVMLRTS